MKPHLTQRIQDQIFLLQELIRFQFLDPNGFDTKEEIIVQSTIELLQEIEELLQ